jgi:nitroreductase
MSYKTQIFRYTPPAIHKLLRDVYFFAKLLPGHFYDYCRFFSYSGLNKSRTSQPERAARITLYYHQVEKGLSLANPRAGFGMMVIPDLLNDIDKYFTEYGVVEPATTAIAALHDYLEHHKRIGHETDFVHRRVSQVLNKHHISWEQSKSWGGGVRSISRVDLLTARNAGFKSFFESRYSIRQFAGGLIPPIDIRRAVELAQKTPSVCNRQSWRVHAFNDDAKIKRLLEIQNGSRGFGDQASFILVITCDLRSFLSTSERYQPWIDGGMFAMSLCLALHDLGYGSCCLNWSKEPSDDKLMRAEAGIGQAEQIIMLLAVGNLLDEFTVAHSYRPTVDHLLVMHGS